MEQRRLTWTNRLALAGALLFTLFPIIWLLVSSFKPWDQLIAPSDSVRSWIPSEPSLRSYRDVFFPYESLMGRLQDSSWRSLISSTIISLVATAVSVGFGLLAAIGSTRYRAGGKWMPVYVLSFRMIRPMAIAIPIAILLAPLGVTNTPLLLPAIYAAVTVPLSTLMLKSFIEQVPPQLEEAAMLDGMSRWQAHFQITTPMIKGGLLATILFVFILNWTETPIALAIAQGQYVPVPIQIINKTGSAHVQVALAVLGMVPPLLIALLIQRHLGRGFTFGIIKG